MSNQEIWHECLDKLRATTSAEEFNAWLMPLHPELQEQTLVLLAPNRYVLEHVKKNLSPEIEKTVLSMQNGIRLVQFEIGGHPHPADTVAAATPPLLNNLLTSEPRNNLSRGNMNLDFTFNNHVEGASNQLARAAAQQVGERPGKSYNPLFIYGNVGLGKTHLMQAAGNLILANNPKAKVTYVRSEVFVNNMVNALKNNKMNDFKQHYRSLDVLLIDDIQFFARKTQSQEEFFHTFNSLFEGQRQIVITSDRIPKAISHIEERLISRFSSGLTVCIEPPELETRVAILKKKAGDMNFNLSDEIAFFVANVARANVRELEGALQRLIAKSRFTCRDVDIDSAHEALRDLLIYRETQVNIDHIQQLVAEYYKIRVSDMSSKSRARTIARPRQMAMHLAKEYTNLSLPLIGDRFGGRDHTTVLHACRTIKKLLSSDSKIKEDHRNLQRLLGD